MRLLDLTHKTKFRLTVDVSVHSKCIIKSFVRHDKAQYSLALKILNGKVIKVNNRFEYYRMLKHLMTDFYTIHLRLVVQGYINFVRIYTTPRRTWDKSIVYYTNRFRKWFWSKCVCPFDHIIGSCSNYWSKFFRYFDGIPYTDVLRPKAKRYWKWFRVGPLFSIPFHMTTHFGKSLHVYL